MNKILKAKKSYGQHFLINGAIAQKIVSKVVSGTKNLLEVGPGKGALTRFLYKNDTFNYLAVESDGDMIDYLRTHVVSGETKIIHKDFLKLDFETLFEGKPFNIIGNFPYNISSQIIFKALENRHLVPGIVGMFQKELAERIVAVPGSKIYGIISVLTQVYYEAELLFYVEPDAFSPPPRVMSSIIRLNRKKQQKLPCSEKLFKTVVKQSFGQRRKMLRNTLKTLIKDELILSRDLFSKRPEALPYETFIEITKIIEKQNEQFGK